MTLLRDYLLFGGQAGRALLLKKASEPQVGGQVLGISTTLFPGTATGEAHVPGQVLIVNVGLQAGAASGAANAPGAVLERGVTLLAGIATGEARVEGTVIPYGPPVKRVEPIKAPGNAPGRTLNARVRLIPGKATGAAMVDGQELTAPILHYYSVGWTEEHRRKLQLEDEALLLGSIF